MPEIQKVILEESMTAEAFSKQSIVFDDIYGVDEMISYKRHRVRAHALKWLPDRGRILELNCGTGEDAIFFAGKGHKVHATDISEGMLYVMEKKVGLSGMRNQITYESCSFTQLDHLKDRGPYDLIFSNFGGLNCTKDLKKVLRSLDPLLKPGAVVTLVIISNFSLWETLLLAKGKWKTATRRWFRKRSASAKVEGRLFTCWYYSPNFVKDSLSTYELLRLEGLCTLVPPSYMENFHLKYPRLYRWLQLKEEKWSTSFPWRVIGDYFIISLKKPV